METVKAIKTLEEKLQEQVDREIDITNKTGSSKFSTCSNSNWDKDIYRHRQDIVETIRKKGYNVHVSVNWGVIDIVTTNKIKLN